LPGEPQVIGDHDERGQADFLARLVSEAF